MSLTLEITLAKDRSKLGTARLLGAGGLEFINNMPCLGISDNAAAIAHNNPTHNPLMQYGNTPTGLCTIIRIAPGADQNGFGPFRRFFLQPVSGQILEAESEPYNRSGLLCHGGTLNPAYVSWKGLRPTYGCVRFSNENMDAMNKAMDLFPASEIVCQIMEI